jgi:hypothetical protein
VREQRRRVKNQNVHLQLIRSSASDAARASNGAVVQTAGFDPATSDCKPYHAAGGDSHVKRLDYKQPLNIRTVYVDDLERQQPVNFTHEKLLKILSIIVMRAYIVRYAPDPHGARVLTNTILSHSSVWHGTRRVSCVSTATLSIPGGMFYTR